MVRRKDYDLLRPIIRNVNISARVNADAGRLDQFIFTEGVNLSGIHRIDNNPFVARICDIQFPPAEEQILRGVQPGLKKIDAGGQVSVHGGNKV